MLGSLFAGLTAAPCEIDVNINKVDNRKNGSLKDKQGNTFKAPVFSDGEDIKGQVAITLNKNKRIEHLGIRVELIGVIENLYDKNQNSTFL